MVPLGIVVGMFVLWVLSAYEHVLLGVQAFITAVSAGTFIYVAVVDVVLHAFSEAQDKYLKFSALVFGAVLMTAILLSLAVYSNDL
jgi:zinc transporter ZupT